MIIEGAVKAIKDSVRPTQVDTAGTTRVKLTTHQKSADGQSQSILSTQAQASTTEEAKQQTNLPDSTSINVLNLRQSSEADSTKSDNLYSGKDRTPGIEGLRPSYTPRTDDFIAIILLCCFLLTSIILERGKKNLFQKMKDFISHRERNSIFDTSTASDLRYSMVLAIQTSVLSGIVILNYFLDATPKLFNHLPPHIILSVYIGICILYIIIKWVIYSILGWIFFDRSTRRGLLESYSTLVYFVGFMLFPICLLLIYYDLEFDSLLFLGLSLIVFIKILMLYKWVMYFLKHFHGLFLLILYFCALEILPCLLLYQGLFQMNSLLLIKL